MIEKDVVLCDLMRRAVGVAKKLFGANHD